MHIFAPCPRGLEELLVTEFTRCGLTQVEQVAGGVRAAPHRKACTAPICTRVSPRHPSRLAVGAYRKEEDLYQMARKIAWHQWFDVSQSFKVSTTAVKSPLRSLDFATLRIKDGLCDRFRADRGVRPDVNTDQSDQRVQLFLERNHRNPVHRQLGRSTLATRLSPCSRRSAAQEENLAAGILALAGWNDLLDEEPGKPVYEIFLDPMCGSGTIAIEAAWMRGASAARPESLFCVRGLAWVLDRASGPNYARRRAAKFAHCHHTLLFASDIHGGTIAATRRHLQQVGLSDAVTLDQADFIGRSAPAAKGLLVTNPPYGVRLSEQEEYTQISRMGSYSQTAVHRLDGRVLYR